MITNEAVLQVLKNVYRHLRPGGLFIVEYWHAAAMLRGYEPIRVRRWDADGGELVRISQTELRYAEQLAVVNYQIYDLKNNGTYHRLEETQMNRYFAVQEMEQFLNSAGFIPRKTFAGFTSSEEISDQTWHVVALAQKG